MLVTVREKKTKISPLLMNALGWGDDQSFFAKYYFLEWGGGEFMNVRYTGFSGATSPCLVCKPCGRSICGRPKFGRPKCRRPKCRHPNCGRPKCGRPKCRWPKCGRPNCGRPNFCGYRIARKGHTCRVGQNGVYAPYMTVLLVIFLPKLPCMVMPNPTHWYIIRSYGKKSPRGYFEFLV